MPGTHSYIPEPSHLYTPGGDPIGESGCSGGFYGLEGGWGYRGRCADEPTYQTAQICSYTVVGAGIGAGAGAAVGSVVSVPCVLGTPVGYAVCASGAVPTGVGIGAAVGGVIGTAICSLTNDNADDDGIKAGDEVGGITATEEDEADDIFDPDADPDQEPRNEEEADAVREAVREDLGEIEMKNDGLDDPEHAEDEKMSYQNQDLDIRIHYYRHIPTNRTYHGKIKRRYGF